MKTYAKGTERHRGWRPKATEGHVRPSSALASATANRRSICAVRTSEAAARHTREDGSAPAYPRWYNPSTMRAVRYHGPNRPFQLEEVERKEPGPGEVLLRVTASGMCHTELHFRSGLLDLGVAPVTMGHEVVGRIEAVGEGVAPDRTGERVVVYYYLGCMECSYCRVGDEICVPTCAPSTASSQTGGTPSTSPSRHATQCPSPRA